MKISISGSADTTIHKNSEIRLFDNAKSGTKANQFAIDPATLGGFMAKAKAGLGDNIKLAALPTENTSLYQFNDTNSS